MKYTVVYSGLFKRSFKACLKRGLDSALFAEVVTILATEGQLPRKYKPHKLADKYKGYWECHIQPDWLLIWNQDDTILRLLLVDTGTHSSLFNK